MESQTKGLLHAKIEQRMLLGIQIRKSCTSLHFHLEKMNFGKIGLICYHAFPCFFGFANMLCIQMHKMIPNAKWAELQFAFCCSLDCHFWQANVATNNDHKWMILTEQHANEK